MFPPKVRSPHVTKESAIIAWMEITRHKSNWTISAEGQQRIRWTGQIPWFRMYFLLCQCFLNVLIQTPKSSGDYEVESLETWESEYLTSTYIPTPWASSYPKQARVRNSTWYGSSWIPNHLFFILALMWLLAVLPATGTCVLPEICSVLPSILLLLSQFCVFGDWHCNQRWSTKANAKAA